MKAFILLLLTMSLNVHSANLKQGEKLQGLKLHSVNELLTAPSKYQDKRCAVSGTVEKICEKKGCWLSLKDDASQSTIRMSFKDYGFFVAKDIIGKKIIAEGKVSIKTLSDAQVAHLKSDGAKLTSNREVSFVAAGLEVQ